MADVEKLLRVLHRLVDAGNIVHAGDATGIVAVPRGSLNDVLTRAEALHALDCKMETAIREGKTLAEAVKLTGYV
jgi:regulator of RNase E activity RraA